jgi:hypothetical protein
VASHVTAQACFVGADLAVGDREAGELGEPRFGIRAGGTGQGRPVRVGAGLGEELARARASSPSTSSPPQDGYPRHGQRGDRVQDPDMSTEIILANSTVADWWAGIGFIRWATLCSYDYRDGIAPHTDW